MISIMTAMEKNYSQKIARVFEIVDYFMLVPAAIGALVGLAALSWNPLVTLLIYAGLAVGLLLLVGYFKHSRNTLDSKYFATLWITTAVYNSLLLLPILYYVATMYQEINYEELNGGLVVWFCINLGIVFSYITAVVFSLKAYSFDKYRKVYGI
jgi:hypothetical protein